MTTVRKGSKGDAVKQLQTLLNAAGYDCGTADGIFGAKTARAVIAYQRANGLSPDGICGARTWAKLMGEEEPSCEIPCEDLKQYASPHGSMIYGPDKTYTTYKSGGCGVASFAIAQRAYGLCPDGETGTETIQRLGRYSWEHGYRVKGQGTKPGLFGTNGTSASSTGSQAKILEALQNGKLVILLIKKGFPNGYTGSGHYVVAYGLKDGYVLIRDVGSSATARQRCIADKVTTGLKSAYIMTKR